MTIPKGVFVAVILTVLTFGCSSASGGGSRNVPLSNFSTNPIVQVKWPRMTLTIPPSNAVSVGSVSPKVKIEGDNILIEAKYILRQKPATTTFDLSKLGMKKEQASSAKAFWVDPDGTRQPLKIEQATQ